MKFSILPVEAIHERDIDLLLLEELTIDVPFCKWFIKELNLPKLTIINGAWRSISDYGLGETDIMFSYNSDNIKVLVLIENKLDASFQNEQYTRYLNRANKYLKNKECDEAYCALVAPELYCENQNNFDIYISYELIAQRFKQRDTKRSRFKCKLLKIAIEKLRRGYHPVNSLPVQKFWHAYWKYKEVKHPDLIMKKPGIVPHKSDWPMLFDDRLTNVIFYHKLAQGNTDATFKGYDDEFETQLKKITPTWAKFVKHSKSFSIRVFSGKIDRIKDFNDQIKNVENGLKNIEKIRDWLLENINYLQL